MGVLTGWMNGRWELRRLNTGEMIFKNQLKSSISAIITGSFNESHNESITVFDAQGAFELFTPLDIIKVTFTNTYIIVYIRWFIFFGSIIVLIHIFHSKRNKKKNYNKKL